MQLQKQTGKIAVLFLGCILLACNGGNTDQSSKSNTHKDTKKTVKAMKPFKQEGTLEIFTETGESVVQIPIEIADNDAERTQGLMHRRSLPGEWGMLFIFDKVERQAFWMKNTHIPIDIMFIDAQLIIDQVAINALPGSEESIRSSGLVKYVLEVPAGFSTAYQISAGFRISYAQI